MDENQLLIAENLFYMFQAPQPNFLAQRQPK